MLVTIAERCDAVIFSGCCQPVHYAGLFTIASMCLGIGLLSVIRNSGVSVIQGVLMYCSLWSDGWDFQSCLI